MFFWLVKIIFNIHFRFRVISHLLTFQQSRSSIQLLCNYQSQDLEVYIQDEVIFLDYSAGLYFNLSCFALKLAQICKNYAYNSRHFSVFRHLFFNIFFRPNNMLRHERQKLCIFISLRVSPFHKYCMSTQNLCLISFKPLIFISI